MTVDPNELARIFDEMSHHDPDSSDPMIRNAHALRREVERLRERNGLNELADALAPLVEHVKEQKAEIERLRADAKQARQAYDALSSAAATNYEAKDAEIERLRADNERLRALLTEARKWVADWGDLTPTMVEPVLARIDAALGGGAPCATCNGTGKVERWYVHSNSTSGGKPCPDCSGVAS